MNFIEIMKYYAFNIYDPKKVRVNDWPEGIYLYKNLKSHDIIKHNLDGTEELYKINYLDIAATNWEICGDLSDQSDKIIEPDNAEVAEEELDYEKDSCTQSITRSWVIDTKEGAENFIKALEESEKQKKEQPKICYNLIRGKEELLEFMKEWKKENK